MGAVYGVSLKYVALSAASGFGARSVLLHEANAASLDTPQTLLVWFLCYTSVLNGVIALMFNFGVGMRVIGKSSSTGAVPLWSYLVFFSFHFPTWLYTSLHHLKDRATRVPTATEVEPGWWVGGRYAADLNKRWAGVVDMTCEFPEGCSASTDQYLLLPCWDGTPPPPESIERAAVFAVSASAAGDVLVHCAHGRGRSTTVMCACLVKSDLYPNWEKALEAIKRNRRVAKLNPAMRAALSAWQSQYVDSTPKKAAAPDPDSSDAEGPGSWGLGRMALQRLRHYGRSKIK